MKSEDIDKARRILELGKTATLKEVKEAYRRLARTHHPDREGSKEYMSEVNKAYQTIMEYIEGYEYSFTPEEVRRQDPEIIWEEGMISDPVWGREPGGSTKAVKSSKRKTDGF
jgi:hypothetical protein